MTKYELEEQEILHERFRGCCECMTEEEIKKELDSMGCKFHRPKIFFTVNYDGIMDLRANQPIEVERLWLDCSMVTPKKKKKEFPFDLDKTPA